MSKQEVPKRCLVTGSAGFVGRRLVEMLYERGAERVVGIDLAPAPEDALRNDKITYLQVDITDEKAVSEACKDIDCVFHIAALVGPYHPKPLYRKVNYDGTINILNACKEHKVKKLVMSSSPSTRFDGSDVKDVTEQDLYEKFNGDYPPTFLQEYAATKAAGEKAVREACCDELMTIAVAPHQVYGPGDGLFLPSLLTVAGNGRLRIFGDGKNMVSFCHVDNYCHGLICGANALYKGSPALGKYYVVTDGPGQNFWDRLDEAVVTMGFTSLKSKFHLNYTFMLGLSHLVVGVGHVASFVTRKPQHVINKSLRLNPFAVKMLCIHRSFDISAARKDLKYEPLISFEDGWKSTQEWFKQHWLPTYKAQN